ncbi:hypothetical protein ACH5RR_022743 [Cinchona calisaya]|uniref:Uncharacterized protein n=1 Tax=Cinchona calisaya TaxID=153742 RepID=A0ABD2Z8N0_9GENT
MGLVVEVANDDGGCGDSVSGGNDRGKRIGDGVMLRWWRGGEGMREVVGGRVGLGDEVWQGRGTLSAMDLTPLAPTSTWDVYYFTKQSPKEVLWGQNKAHSYIDKAIEMKRWRT